MDPGQQLLSLIAGRVAKGANHYAAQREVFAAHADLVRAWHNAEGQDEPETSRRHDVPDVVDPGHALLSLATAYERAGMDATSARTRAFAEHPALVQAWNVGQLIPRPPRPRLPSSGGLRRLQSDDARQLRPGETMLHRLCDPASGGGFFAMAA